MIQSSTPFHAAKLDLLDAIQSIVPPSVGYRMNAAQYGALRSTILKMAGAFDEAVDAMIVEAKLRAPCHASCVAIGSPFTDALSDMHGVMETLDTLEAGAAEASLEEAA